MRASGVHLATGVRGRARAEVTTIRAQTTNHSDSHSEQIRFRFRGRSHDGCGLELPSGQSLTHSALAILRARVLRNHGSALNCDLHALWGSHALWRTRAHVIARSSLVYTHDRLFARVHTNPCKSASWSSLISCPLPPSFYQFSCLYCRPFFFWSTTPCTLTLYSMAFFL